MKTILKIALALAIGAFIFFSVRWKSKEQETQVAYTQSHSISTDIVETQTQRMMEVNAQTAGLMSGGETASPSSGSSSSGYTPTRSSYEDEPILVVTGTYIVKTGKFFGCTQRKDYDNLMKLASQPDTRKFDKLMEKGIASEEYTYFTKGDAVVLEEIYAGKTAVRVSRFGKNKSYWTSINAIK